MQNKTDRRTERTHKAIIDAFTALIIEKDFEEITVKELAERANVNRKTFYFHYKCIEEVLEELQVEICKRLMDIYKKNNYGQFNVVAFTNSLNEILSENYELYRKLVVANSYRFFSRAIKDSLKTVFISQYTQAGNVDKEKMALIAEFCVRGIISMYKVWFETETSVTKEELATLSAKMINGGLSAVMESEK